MADQVTVTVVLVRDGARTTVALTRPLTKGGNPTKHREQLRVQGTDVLSAAIAAVGLEG